MSKRVKEHKSRDTSRASECEKSSYRWPSASASRLEDENPPALLAVHDFVIARMTEVVEFAR